MSEFALSLYGENVDGQISFQWSEGNSPMVLASGLENMVRDLSDMTVPLALSRQKFVDSVRANFEQEMSPDGSPWQDWAESYAARAQSENIGILRKTEDLFHAATDPGAYPIIGNDLWINTGGFPEYWAVHNYGSEPGPNRAPIPQRQYLGFSEEEMFQVVDIFDGWFNRTIQAVFNPFSVTPRLVHPTTRRFMKFEG